MKVSLLWLSVGQRNVRENLSSTHAIVQEMLQTEVEEIRTCGSPSRGTVKTGAVNVGCNDCASLRPVTSRRHVVGHGPLTCRRVHTQNRFDCEKQRSVVREGAAEELATDSVANCKQGRN